MTAEKQPATLHQKIAAIMAELGPIEKTGQNTFQKYRFITAELLFATLQKKLAAAGVVVIPMIDAITLSPGNKTENLLATMRIRVVNADNPTDCIDIPWYAQGGAGDDKGVAKCATSGLKYALMRLFLISDEEDPDAESEGVKEPAKASKPAPQPQQRQRPTPLRPGQAATPLTGNVPDDETLRTRGYQLLQADQEAVKKLEEKQLSLQAMTGKLLADTVAWLERRARERRNTAAGGQG